MPEARIVKQLNHPNGNPQYTKDEFGLETWYREDGSIMRTRDDKKNETFYNHDEENTIDFKKRSNGDIIHYQKPPHQDLIDHIIYKDGSVVSYYEGTEVIRYEHDRKKQIEKWYREDETLWEEKQKFHRDPKDYNSPLETRIIWYHKDGVTRNKTEDSLGTIIEYDELNHITKKTEKTDKGTKTTLYYEDERIKEIIDEKGNRNGFWPNKHKRFTYSATTGNSVYYREKDETPVIIKEANRFSYLKPDRKPAFVLEQSGVLTFLKEDGATPDYSYQIPPSREYKTTINYDTGTITVKTLDGKPYREIDINGIVTLFDENGQKKAVVNHKNEVLAEYYPSGTLKYAVDKKGNRTWYREDKTKERIIEKDGYETKFYEDGTTPSYETDHKGNEVWFNNDNPQTVLREVTQSYGEVRYYPGTTAVAYSKDKNDFETWYQKDGKTISHTRDTKGNETFYRPAPMKEEEGFARRQRNKEEKPSAIKTFEITPFDDGSKKGKRITIFEADGATVKGTIDLPIDDTYQFNIDKKGNLHITTEAGLKFRDITPNGLVTVYDEGTKFSTITLDGTILSMYHKNGNLKYQKGPNNQETLFYETGGIKTILKDHVVIEERNPDGNTTYQLDESGNKIWYNSDKKKSHMLTPQNEDIYYQTDGETISYIIDAQKNETWYQQDGKTVKYTKDNKGFETWYYEDGETISRTKDAKGYEIWYAMPEPGSTEQKKLKERLPFGTETEYYEDGITIKHIKDNEGNEFWYREDKTLEESADASGLHLLYDEHNQVIAKEKYYDEAHEKLSFYEDENGTQYFYREDESLERKITKDGKGEIYGSDGKTVIGYIEDKTEYLYFEGTNVVASKKSADGSEVYYRNDDEHTITKEITAEKITINYAADGKTITSEINEEGSETFYTPDKKKQKIVNKDGSETGYYPDGETVKYTIDEEKHKTYYRDDKEHSVSREEFATGVIIDYYGNKEHPSYTKDENGTETWYELDDKAKDGVKKICDRTQSGAEQIYYPDGEHVRMAIDEHKNKLWRNKQGKKVREVQANGAKIWYNSDEIVVRSQNPDGTATYFYDDGTYKGSKTADGTTTFYYPGTDIPSYKKLPSGEEIWYRSNGTKEKSIIQTDNPILGCKETHTTHYSEKIRPHILMDESLTIEEPIVISTTRSYKIGDDRLTETTEYWESGIIKKTVDEYGSQKIYREDSTLQSEYSSVTETLTSYHKDGKTVAYVCDGDGNETWYNAKGKRTKEIDYENNTTEYFYRQDGRLSHTTLNGTRYDIDGIRENILSQKRRLLAKKFGLEDVRIPKKAKKAEEKLANIIKSVTR